MAGNGYSVDDILEEIRRKKENGAEKSTVSETKKDHSEQKGDFFDAAAVSLKAVKILIKRYLSLIETQKENCSEKRNSQKRNDKSNSKIKGYGQIKLVQK